MKSNLRAHALVRKAMPVFAALVLAASFAGSAAAAGTVSGSIANQNPLPVLQGNSATFQVTLNNGTDTGRYFSLMQPLIMFDGLRVTDAGSCVYIASGGQGTFTVTISTNATWQLLRPVTPTGADAFSLWVISHGRFSCGIGIATDVLNGTIDVVKATTTTIASSANPSTLGQNVTLTATVTGTDAGHAPTGTVQYMEGATLLGTGAVTGGVATLLINPTAGHHSITAVYGGDLYNAASTSLPLDQFVEAPSFTLDKAVTSSGTPAVGASVTYSYTLTNTGNVTLAGPFSVTDSLIPSVDCSGASASLAPGASTGCVGSYVVQQADFESGHIYNAAGATITFRGVAITQTDSVDILLVQDPSLGLAKTADIGTASKAGDTIAYTYALTNIGNVTLDGPFTVVDSVIATVDCSGAAATLAPDATTTCTATYALTQPDVDKGSVYNEATATGSFHEKPVTASDNATVTLTQTPGLGIVKAAVQPNFAAAGDVIDYTYTVTNTGNVTFSGPFLVSDDKIANVVCPATSSLTPGASIVCHASYTVTAADVTAGHITNVAAARAILGTEVSFASAPATVTISMQAVQGVTSAPTLRATPPPTSTDGGPGGNGGPLFVLLICLGLGGIGLLAAKGQRRVTRG
jgi:uncharacterized repeat protein (TIGR01451 family)